MLTLNGGEIVRLRRDCPSLGLRAGDLGWVWGVYAGPSSVEYEATFRGQDGQEFDMDFRADEVEIAAGLTEHEFLAMRHG